MKLVETQLSARLRLGDAVIGELEAAVATAPVPGGAVGAADHRAVPRGPPGRRAGRLPAGPARLADELGLEPGPRLQQLEQQILDHDPALRRPDRAAPAGNLPSLSAELVGRDDGDRRPVRAARTASGSSRSSGRAASARRRVAIATGRALSGVPGGVWLARLEAAQTADDVLDTVIAALDVTGGEAALFERLKARRRGGDPRQLRARRRRGRGARGAPARRRPRAADPVHEPGRARRRRRGRVRARAARARRRRRAVHPPRRPAAATPARCTTCAARSTACRWRSSSPRRGPRRCRSRRSPAASTTASAC